MRAREAGRERAMDVSRRRSGCSAAWLARLPWEQEVAGSNPAAPTIIARGTAAVDLEYGKTSVLCLRDNVLVSPYNKHSMS